MVKVAKLIPDYESWVPWIIGFVIVLIIFPYDKIKKYFTPDPIIQYQYVEVPVPQYIYIEKPQEIAETKSQEVVKEVVKESIICVFDIDNTLTIGDPSRCIKMCKDMGCRIAFNTSSDMETPGDLPLDEWGFTKPNFDPDDYYFDPNSKTSNFDDAAATKSNNMATLKNKYNITDSKRLILFDDNRINIEKVIEDGYSGIHIGSKNPGIQESDIIKAHKLILELD